MMRRSLVSTTSSKRGTLMTSATSTTVSSVRWASSSSGGGDPNTFFGVLDRMFTYDAVSIDAASTLSFGASAMCSLQQCLGWEGGLILLAGGALTRFSTLYASLYGERASWRMVQALPELKPAYDAFQHTYNSDRGNASEVQIGAAHLSAQKKEVFRKYQTSNLKTLAGLAVSPIVVMGLRAASQMCDPFNIDGFGTSEVLWMTMSAVDPTFILPATVSALTLLNFELTLRNREDVTVGWTKNVVMAARGGAVIGFGLASQMSSGVLLYWLGMSLVGVIQPLLVRSSAFRSFAGFPEIGRLAPKPIPSKTTVPGFSAIEEREAEKQDNYRMRFGINHPFLNKLFNPDTEEHLDLITRSTVPSTGASGATVSGSSSRAAAAPSSSYGAAGRPTSSASTASAEGLLSRERSSVPMSHHPNLSKITRPNKPKSSSMPSQHENSGAAIKSFDELAGDFRYDPEEDRPSPAQEQQDTPPSSQQQQTSATNANSWKTKNRKL